MHTANHPAQRLGHRGRRYCLGLATAAIGAVVIVGSATLGKRLAARYGHATLVLAQERRLSLDETLAAPARFSLDRKAGVDRESPRRFSLTATAYCPLCGSEDGQPQASALGGPVRPGHTIAVSQDLKNLLGRKVYIEGLGTRVIEDLMHPRHSQRMDLCLPNRAQAVAFGVQRLEIVVLD